MDALHSYTLFISLAALLAALAAWFVSRGPVDPTRRRRLCHATATAADLSLVLIILSMCLHLIFGHRPGTPDAMSFVTFLGDHRAYLVVPIAATLVGHWGRRGTARSDG